MNKSLITNIISAILIPIGYFSPIWNKEIFTIGLFATSGAITNWLAIYMLFEKIPLLYGSGVIPARFEDFKKGIRNLIMEQFFTAENVRKFFSESNNSTNKTINPDSIVKLIDFSSMFTKLKETVLESPFGGMLGMVGGESALEPLKEPFERKMEEEIKSLLSSKKFTTLFQEAVNKEELADTIIDKVEIIIDKRLEELTPQKVKEIIQEMIRKHLGWLVVWGGIFGGLIGLITSIMPFDFLQ